MLSLMMSLPALEIKRGPRRRHGRMAAIIITVIRIRIRVTIGY